MKLDKINGRTVLILSLFALALVACSNDDSKSVAGGASEETGLYALAGRVGDSHPRMLTDQGGESSDDGSSQYAPKGTIVTVYELDSLTLDTTGRYFVDTIDNDNGLFKFDSLPVESPYVLIETQDSCITENCSERGAWTLSWILPMRFDSEGVHVDSSTMFSITLNAIVDLRDSQKVSVNSLTRMKAPLVQQYFAEGMSFAEASQKAQQEILENLGIYEDLGDFETLENDELPYVIELVSLIPYGYDWLVAHLISTQRRYGGKPRAVFAAFGEAMEGYYLSTIKLADYEAAYIAHEAGLGRCTESRDGEYHSVEFDYEPHSFVCHSGKWISGVEKMEYTKGTMVDNRDGKTYKTVTYTWNGVPVTWMAENLNFEDTTSSNVDSTLKKNLLGKTRCYENDPTCEIFGRFYAWSAAMNLDSSTLKVVAWRYRDYYDEESESWKGTSDSMIVESGCLTGYPFNPVALNPFYRVDFGGWTRENDYSDTAMYRYCIEKYTETELSIDYSRFISDSRPVQYQGVCPDGWRIPNNSDWLTLFAILRDKYAEMRISPITLLGDSYATGFDYVPPMSILLEDSTNLLSLDIIDMYTTNYAAVPDVDDENAAIFAYMFNNEHESILSWKFNRFDQVSEPTLVRCVKN